LTRVTGTVAALSLTTGVALASTPAAASIRSVHMEVQPTGVTVGVGPLGDGFGLLPQTFLLWQTVPPGDTYEGVWYSASILGVDWPGVGRIPYFPTAYDRSVAAGEDALKEKLATKAPGEQVRVVGMSLGAIIADNVASQVKKTDTSPDLSYLLIGNPQRTDGGFLTRFGNFTIPILNVTFGRSTPEESDYPVTDLAFQYDFMADFPNYFNPLALANSALGLVYTHIYPGYLFGNAYPDPDDPDNLVQTVGNTTYITMPTDLPLLFPLRVPLSLVGMGHVVDALDALIRPWVDAAYDRTDDPGETHPFEFGTPQANIDAAWAKMPEAIQTAIAVLFGAPYHPKIVDTPAPTSSTGDTSTALVAAKSTTDETVSETKTAESQSDSVDSTGKETPATSEPGTTESGATEPATSSEPATTEPAATEPAATEPGTTQPSTESSTTTPGAGEQHTGTDTDGAGEDKTGDDTTSSSGTTANSSTGTGTTGSSGAQDGSGSGSSTEGTGSGSTGGKHRADDSDDDSGSEAGNSGTESSSTGKHAADTGTTSNSTGTKTQSTTSTSESGHSEKSSGAAAA